MNLAISHESLLWFRPPKDPGGSALYHNGTHAAGFLNGAREKIHLQKGYHGDIMGFPLAVEAMAHNTLW